jgi:hypothetical protein
VQYFLNDFLQMRRERNMMSRRIFAITAVAATLAALPAQARNPAPIDSGTAAGSSGHFSVITGETVATGRDMVSAEAGFPGFTFGWTHGLSDRFDAGVKLDLLYGRRYTTLFSTFGMQLHAPLRYMTYRRGQIGVQVHVDPGLDFYTGANPCAAFGFNCGQNASFALNVPVGVTVGFQVTHELRVAAGADLVMSLAYAGPGTAFLQIGPLFGGAVEYYFEKQWVVGFNLRFGPQFYAGGQPLAPLPGGPGTQLGFITEATVGYRL